MKKNLHIMLNGPAEAEEFVEAASKCNFDIDLYSGVVAIDAKSILGVLTMGTNRVMRVDAQANDPVFDKVLSKFAVPAA